MIVAYSRSEVVLSTDPAKLFRSPPMPESVVTSCLSVLAEKEVIPVSLSRRVPPRSQREWHRVFGADA